MACLTSVNTPADLKALNSFLESRSYIKDFAPSQADTAVFDALSASSVDKSPYDHVVRWYKHISSFGDKKNGFAGDKKTLAELAIPAGAPAKAAAEDDLDLFGSDEEEDAEAEALKAQRLAEYNAKKAKKPAVIAKSSVIIDVKPWEDTTDLVAMEAAVRGIEMDGLIWGTAKLMPIGYGIKKLQISCAIEDAKVSMDAVEELIMANEDLVQSVDIVAFNKI